MPIIYHYCDANAFMSIVENLKLRLSSTSKMNDLNEGSVTEKYLVSLLKEGDREASIEELRAHIEMAKDEMYACCFSRDPDSTVQWMAYANEGKGFAIGFDVDSLLAGKDYARLQSESAYFGSPSENMPHWQGQPWTRYVLRW